MGVKDRYEQFHHVEYTSEAIEAGRLSIEPLHHRSVPAGQGDRSRGRGRRPGEAEGSGLQRGVRRDQQVHPRRRRTDGERGLAEGLREGAVLPRAGSLGAREPATDPRAVRRQVQHAARGRQQDRHRRGRLEVDRRPDRRRSIRTKATGCCAWRPTCIAA
jgi:hypothetical protein